MIEVGDTDWRPIETGQYHRIMTQVGEIDWRPIETGQYHWNTYKGTYVGHLYDWL